ncbi:MAG: hypothetical protein ACRDPE_04585 [Solirubrobacterales bacterium]
MAFTGIVSIIAPASVHQSVIALNYPAIVFYLFSAVWALGGVLSAVGILRGFRSVEAAGSALLSGGLLVYAGTIFHATSWVTAAFIFCLAVGYAKRAKHLATTGYYVG